MHSFFTVPSASVPSMFIFFSYIFYVEFRFIHLVSTCGMYVDAYMNIFLMGCLTFSALFDAFFFFAFLRLQILMLQLISSLPK